LSLEANIAFPLLLRGVPAGERARAVTEILSRAPARLDASTPVSKLSGGQAQLACVLRGFIARPNLLVCDEPFSAIDYPARIMLRSLIASMCAEYGTSLLFVSHSIEDTVFLADRIVVLSGRPASIAEVISVPNKGSRDNAWLDGEGSADVRRQVRAALDRA
jgi:NitT/TauT family transport system ATP-binding protein